MDSFDLTVNNWDPDGNGPGQGWFKYSDTHIFDPWQEVELSMGYYRNGNDRAGKHAGGRNRAHDAQLSRVRHLHYDRALRQSAAALPHHANHQGLLPEAGFLDRARPGPEHRQGHPTEDPVARSGGR